MGAIHGFLNTFSRPRSNALSFNVEHVIQTNHCNLKINSASLPTPNKVGAKHDFLNTISRPRTNAFGVIVGNVIMTNHM